MCTYIQHSTYYVMLHTTLVLIAYGLKNTYSGSGIVVVPLMREGRSRSSRSINGAAENLPKTEQRLRVYQTFSRKLSIKVRLYSQQNQNFKVGICMQLAPIRTTTCRNSILSFSINIVSSPGKFSKILYQKPLHCIQLGGS